MANAVANDTIWKGPADLREFLVPIESLVEDPANINIHDERSYQDIAASYARYGQQRPVVAQPDGRVVRAGNGQLVAAKRLGWTHLAVVRSDLDGADLVGYAITDNQVARRAHLDQERLAAILHDCRSRPDPVAVPGFTNEEVAEILANARPQGGPDEETGERRDGGGRRSRMEPRDPLRTGVRLHRGAKALVCVAEVAQGSGRVRGRDGGRPDRPFPGGAGFNA